MHMTEMKKHHIKMRPSAFISTSSHNIGRQTTLCLIMRARARRPLSHEATGEIMAVINWALLLSKTSWEPPQSFQPSLCHLLLCLNWRCCLVWHAHSQQCSKPWTGNCVSLPRAGTVLLLMQSWISASHFNLLHYLSPCRALPGTPPQWKSAFIFIFWSL